MVNPFGFARKYSINTVSMRLLNQETAVAYYAKLPGKDNKEKNKAYTKYMGQTVVQSKAQFDLSKHGAFDLEDIETTNGIQMYLRFAVRATKFELKDRLRPDRLIDAHWCPYLAMGTQGKELSRVPYVDLKKTNPDYDFMFTGAMNGCCLVITAPRDDSTKIRVYHDSYSDKDTFRDEVVLLRINYEAKDYACANPVAAPSSSPGTPSTPPVRARAGSLSAPGGGPSLAARGRSLSAPGVLLTPKGPIKSEIPMYCYGNLDVLNQAYAVQGGVGSNRAIVLPNGFNFLYYNRTTSKWTAVSVPQEFMPSPEPPKARRTEFTYKHNARMAAFRDLAEKQGQLLQFSRALGAWHCEVPY
jgi:hypothetical protein